MSSTKITGHDIDPDYKLKQIEVTLPSSGWSTSVPYTQTVTCQGVTSTNIVIVSPKPTFENIEMIGDCKVVATQQGANSLVFTAIEGKPTSNVVFNILTGGE